MRKVIMAAAFAATTILSSASAMAGTTPASCGVDEVRFNPTELSEYQECWLNTHRADETHGVLGSLFYIKVNDVFYSAPLSTLRKLSDPASFFTAQVVGDLEVSSLEAIRENAVVVANETAVKIAEVETVIKLVEVEVPVEVIKTVIKEVEVIKTIIETIEVEVDGGEFTDQDYADLKDDLEGQLIALKLTNANAMALKDMEIDELKVTTVSYTHLTLPTILLV